MLELSQGDGLLRILTIRQGICLSTTPINTSFHVAIHSHTMYGYVGLCMTMYGYVGLCMAMYGYVWLCTCRAMKGYVGLCMAMYGSNKVIWLYQLS